MAHDIQIRAAITADIPAITAIYRQHVLHGLASFEIEPPDTAEMTRRFRAISELGLPYFVATMGGRLAGYAYAATYRARPAYRFTVEDSVYVDGELPGQGIGSALMPALIAGCAAAGRRQIIAVIGDSANHGSIKLHEKFGFKHVGLLPAVGFKFGRWVDSVLMQRDVGQGRLSLPS
ncbi:MAG: N-acetyltransferase family protein [Burkholderiales bacterium]